MASLIADKIDNLVAVCYLPLNLFV
jgi:hypothetical protein